MTTNHLCLPEVLIVEDDIATVTILQIWLRGLFCPTVVLDGDAALRLLDEWNKSGQLFDLFLMDINLPYPWSGLTLKENILKTFPAYRKTPFIAETAYAMPHDQERIMNAGFAAYLPKPLDRILMVETLQNFIR
ncbi:MAG: response regulator [Bacteroidales bacterium]|nr:response regulator [Bacteroidales bacterium]MDD4602362.1 response regulator [Bacteroidales bacterium]